MIKNKKKSLVLLVLIFTLIVTACSQDKGKTANINLVSREDGSGTRGAFVEIVELVDEEGEDATSLDAAIQDGTSKVLTTVAGDKNSIGYISLGSLNDQVKPLSIDGVKANEENILNESYEIARPFLLVYKSEDDMTPITKDFISYILSKEGQEIVKESYVTINSDARPYIKKDGLEGSISITGSTSVGPLVLDLAEKYMDINKNVKIEVQETGSGAGITSAIEGNSDLGMSSRDLKEDESDKLEKQAIAMDGITVIVSKDNEIDNLSMDQVRKIFKGELKSWEEVISNNEK